MGPVLRTLQRCGAGRKPSASTRRRPRRQHARASLQAMRGARSLQCVGHMLAVLAAVGACNSRDRASRAQPAAMAAGSASSATASPTLTSHAAPPAPSPSPSPSQPPPPLDPKEETDKIVARWLKSLPSYEFRAKMCPIFESTRPPEPLDGWGTPTRTTCHPAKVRYGIPTYLVISAGPDRRFNTADDLKIKGTSYTTEEWRMAK